MSWQAIDSLVDLSPNEGDDTLGFLLHHTSGFWARLVS